MISKISWTPAGQGLCDYDRGWSLVVKLSKIWRVHVWQNYNEKTQGATSILVTDVGDEMCWRLFWDVGDVLAISVTNILYLSTLSSGTNIQKMLPTSKFCHQHPKIVTNIKSPTSTRHQHLCSPHKVLPNFCRVISQYRGRCEKMSGFKSSSISPLHNRLKTLYIRGYFRLCFGHFILVHRMIRLNKGS